MVEPILVKEIGGIWGRDVIYLDKIEFDGTRTVKLVGDLNGSLCENLMDSKFIPFELTFTGLLEFKTIELDFYSGLDYISSFVKVKDSKRLKEFSKSSQSFKLKESHEHYIIYTYDDVIEVVAIGFEMRLK